MSRINTTVRKFQPEKYPFLRSITVDIESESRSDKLMVSGPHPSDTEQKWIMLSLITNDNKENREHVVSYIPYETMKQIARFILEGDEQ